MYSWLRVTPLLMVRLPQALHEVELHWKRIICLNISPDVCHEMAEEITGVLSSVRMTVHHDY